MNRRRMLKTLSYTALPVLLRYGNTAGSSGIEIFDSEKLKELLDSYRSELFEDILPAWYRVGIDNRYGGVMVSISRDGKLKSTNKGGWYQGRALFIFSRVYNRHGNDERHLSTAYKTWEFMKRHSWDNNGDYYMSLSQEGELLSDHKNIFCDIYGVYGAVEYYRATQDEEALDHARKTIHRITERVLSPSFYYRYGSRPICDPGTSWYGVWLHFLPALTHYLVAKADDSVEAIAQLVIRRLINHHIDRENQFVYEIIDGNTCMPYLEMKHRWNWVCHTTQAMWMVMDEAIRIGDRELMKKAIEITRWMLEAYWDREHGGMADIVYLGRPDLTKWQKSLWGHVETILVLLRIIEHTGAPWAIAWYERIREYAYNVFPDREYSNWFISLDREGNHKPDTGNQELFHRPRSVMLSIETLERMIARGGRVSGFLDGENNIEF